MTHTRFDPDTPCILGGVLIPDHAGLKGPLGWGCDLPRGDRCRPGCGRSGGTSGVTFPPSDDTWKGADSLELLRKAVRVLEGQNYQVVNVDVTVVCETPKIGPHVAAIREKLGAVLGVGPGFVSVKGKTNEKMGWIGAGEGLAVHTVALVDRIAGGDTPDEGR